LVPQPQRFDGRQFAILNTGVFMARIIGPESLCGGADAVNSWTQTESQPHVRSSRPLQDHDRLSSQVQLGVSVLLSDATLMAMARCNRSTAISPLSSRC